MLPVVLISFAESLEALLTFEGPASPPQGGLPSEMSAVLEGQEEGPTKAVFQNKAAKCDRVQQGSARCKNPWHAITNHHHHHLAPPPPPGNFSPNQPSLDRGHHLGLAVRAWLLAYTRRLGISIALPNVHSLSLSYTSARLVDTCTGALQGDGDKTGTGGIPDSHLRVL